MNKTHYVEIRDTIKYKDCISFEVIFYSDGPYHKYELIRFHKDTKDWVNVSKICYCYNLKPNDFKTVIDDLYEKEKRQIELHTPVWEYEKN